MTVMLRLFLLQVNYPGGGKECEVKEYGSTPQDAKERAAERFNRHSSYVEVIGELPICP